MSDVPTKPGWYRARWKNEGRESPKRDTYDRDVRETDAGCVFVAQLGTELHACMLGGSVRHLDQFEWGEPVDDLRDLRDIRIDRDNARRGWATSNAMMEEWSHYGRHANSHAIFVEACRLFGTDEALRLFPKGPTT